MSEADIPPPAPPSKKLRKVDVLKALEGPAQKAWSEFKAFEAAASDESFEQMRATEQSHQQQHSCIHGHIIFILVFRSPFSFSHEKS